MGGYRYDDDEDTSILFRPISPDERLSHVGKKPLKPVESFVPPKPGQLYGAAYPSTSPQAMPESKAAPVPQATPASQRWYAQPKPVAAPQPLQPPLGQPGPLRQPMSLGAAPPANSEATYNASFSPPPIYTSLADPAPSASGDKSKLPAYLKKRPSLSPPAHSGEQGAAGKETAHGRITSTFNTERPAPAEEVDAAEPVPSMSGMWAAQLSPETEEAEPLFSAAPPRPAQEMTVGYPPQHADRPQDMAAALPPAPPPVPGYQPYYPVYDEVAAFFTDAQPYGAPYDVPYAAEPAPERQPEPKSKEVKRRYPSAPLTAFDQRELDEPADGTEQLEPENMSLDYSAQYGGDRGMSSDYLAQASEDDSADFGLDSTAGYGMEYELESLPENAELPPDVPMPEELDYQPPLYNPQPESAGGAPLYEPFDPYEPETMYPPQMASPPPAPVYIPEQEASPRSKGKGAAPKSTKKRLTTLKGIKKQPEKQAAPPRPAGTQSAAPPKPPIRWSRVAALVAAAGMLIFCTVAGGRIIFHMATNERAMREVKAAYQEQRGSSLTADAVKVELPPVGVTFAPTVTPAPQLTPVPTARPVDEAMEVSGLAATDEQAAQSLNGLTETAEPVPRTKLSRYPNNTLRNVLDSMKELQSEYPEAIGRLTIPGVLDEVVMQRNNTYYLTHNYRGTLADGGAVYADESCSIKTPPENLLLRGQGSVAGKVFAPLWQYKTGGQSFVASAATATLTTLYEEATYLLLAVIVADSDPSSPDYFNYASHPTFATDEQMMSYVESAVQHSLYRFSTTIDPSDRLLTLATVSSAGDSQCMVLIYRMARENEGI